LRLLSKGKKFFNLHVITMALMNIKKFFTKITKRLRGEPEFADELVENLVRRLQNTHEDELSCDEVFALVDEYAEASQRGEDVANLKPLIRHHLDMCRQCDEEYEALLRVLEQSGTN